MTAMMKLVTGGRLDLVEEMNKVLEVINRGNIEYIDNHDNTINTLQGYVILDKCHVCPIFEDTYFTLNPLYLSEHDNKLHLARPSVGGRMITFNKSIDEAIENYNANQFSPMKIAEYKLFREK